MRAVRRPGDPGCEIGYTEVIAWNGEARVGRSPAGSWPGQSGRTLTVIDATLKIVARIAVSRAPYGLAFAVDGHLLYVAVTGGRHLVVVDMRTDRVVATVRAPGTAGELVLR